MTDRQPLIDLAQSFAAALAAKDHDRLRGLLQPDLDFRAMTPGRVWEAASPEDVTDVLDQWFDDTDEIEDVERLEAEAFSDCGHVGYRLRVRNPDGLHLVGQEAFIRERDGRIGWLRIMCAGYRPFDAD